MANPIPAQTMPLFHLNTHLLIWEGLLPLQQRQAVELLADLIVQHLQATAEPKEASDE